MPLVPAIQLAVYRCFGICFTFKLMDKPTLLPSCHSCLVPPQGHPYLQAQLSCCKIQPACNLRACQHSSQELSQADQLGFRTLVQGLASLQPLRVMPGYQAAVASLKQLWDPSHGSHSRCWFGPQSFTRLHSSRHSHSQTPLRLKQLLLQAHPQEQQGLHSSALSTR